MIWILVAVLIIGFAIGVLLPAMSVVFYKLRASVTGEKISCRQILDMIGY